MVLILFVFEKKVTLYNNKLHEIVVFEKLYNLQCITAQSTLNLLKQINIIKKVDF